MMGIPPSPLSGKEGDPGSLRSPMRLSLGPLLYYWPRQRVLDYYAEVTGWPVDSVYLGETVCARRHELRLDDWLEIADQIAASGKEAILSSQTLIESEAELKNLRRQVEQGRFTVEANDMGAVSLLGKRARPFVAGPTLNVFNGETLGLFAGLGAKRWVMPPEMSGAALASMRLPAAMETEVFALGRLPLAYSARCFTARRFNLQKDACEFRCLDFPEGLALTTREGEAFLTLNGTQTQSARVYNLLLELPALRSAGVDILRLSPQTEHGGDLARLFRACVDGKMSTQAAWDEALALLPGEPCNGFWYARPGLEQVAPTQAVGASTL